MPKGFVSLTAVSSLPQAKKISLEDQLETNREHVKRWNGVMVDELSVPGKSRSISTWEEACAKLPAYARLKELIDAKAFDVLIYRDNSRLGRKTSLIVTIAELCYEAGILLYPTESPPQELTLSKRDLATRLMEIIQSVLAQEEVEKLTRRNEMGMRARVMRGDFPGAVPYGWVERHEIQNNQPTTVVEVDEVAANTIRAIVDLYLRKGLGMRPIAAHLRAHGFVAPEGGQWRIYSVSQTLDNIWRYAGYVELNASKDSKRPYVRAKCKWAAIIPEQDAIAVENERKYRASGKRAVESPHRFSGVAWCGQCGRRLKASAVYDSKGEPISEKYRCRDFETPYTHTKAQIAGNYIMEFVRDAFLELKDESSHERILGQSPYRAQQIRNKMEEITAKIEEKRRTLEKADDMYLDNKLDQERYERQVNRITEEWELLQSDLLERERELEQELFNNQRADRLKEIARNGIAMLETDDIATANAWLRRHIKVMVHNDDPTERVRVVPL